MPSGLHKTTRNKTKRKSAKPESSIPYPGKPGGQKPHPLLGSGDKMDIESWNDTVPQKSSRLKDMPNEQDPNIQAYLEAKLSLFRRAAVAGTPSVRSQSTVSSTNS
ncbi:hypothetical protein LTR09_010798 [Extremus antarcticus]|uniref:Uncharacterized protein n=1 Tax=Extremus antarcticus TaxID=702011 RepID=A0AAJ0G4V2_9PEZI|nr:hypothetical protein LTR09_010798 [Extremus antarcticus]